MRRGSRWIDCRQAARKGQPRGRERVATSQMVQLFWGYGIRRRFKSEVQHSALKS